MKTLHLFSVDILQPCLSRSLRLMVLAGISSAVIACSNMPSVSQYNQQKQAEANMQMFKNLIANNALKEATDHYENYWRDIQKSDEGKELTAQLAEKITSEWNPKLNHLDENINDIAKNSSINNQTQWPAIKAKLQEVELTMESIKKNSVINRPQSLAQWEAFNRLSQSHTNLSKSIENNLKDNFNSFNKNNEDFFKVYPFELDRVDDDVKSRIKDQIFPIIQQKFSQSKKLEDSTSLLHTYGQYLNHPQRSKLAREWSKQYAKSKSWKAPLSMKQRLEALQHLTKDTNLSHEDWITAAYIPVNTTDQQSLAALSKKMGSHLSNPIEPSAITATVKNLEKENHDFIVFIHIPGQKWSSKTTGKTTETAQFLAHEEKKQNPELQTLRERLAREQQSLVSARQSASLSQTTNANAVRQGGGMALLGALAQGLGTMAVAEAERDVQRAQNELNSAPSTVSTPVYQNYQRVKVTRKNHISLPVNTLIFDTAGKRYYALSDVLSKEHEFSYTDPGSVKVRDKNPPQKIDLAGQWSAFQSDFHSKELQQYSLNISHLTANDKKKELSAKKVNTWANNPEKNLESNNQKLLADLKATSNELSAGSDSPLQFYKRIRQRYQ